ncbi:hypothetical protein ACHAW5_002693 [Stephanodiscus triporus]|uniref:SnoaL-like domain-containing protein n=1 Tax=Stephanodiscus triporus TaxID=2934178 RepID=A0ABD3N1F4_9STRA
MLPPVLLLAFARDSQGYGIGIGAVVPPRHRPSPSTGGRPSASASASRDLAAGGRTTTELAAGLRDLVGPYDEDYSEYGSASSPSVRDERNSAFAGAGRRGGAARRAGGGFDYDDFDDLPIGGPYSGGRPTSRLGGGRIRGGGGGGGVPQVYRREYIDSLDGGRRFGGGRSFDSLTPVERYFEAWNRRDVPLALSCFDDDVYYDDTQFSEPFEGKSKLADHLLYVSDCLPESFYFVVDELSVGRAVRGGGNSGRRGRRDRSGGAPPAFQLGRDRAAIALRRASDAPSIGIGALWHVENEYGPLPFARGSSFFKVDPSTGLIFEAYDFPEPAAKAGSTGLKLLSVASKLVGEPRRWLPFFGWIVYVYVVHFSNGILPGKDIFHADPRTWREIQDLSFNFMFVAPVTHVTASPKLNPVLEGIFNGLLAWSFLFAGFLSDERSGAGPYKGKDSRYYDDLIRGQEQVLDNGVVLVPPVSITKRNLIALVPTIVGMQFLTSAFLLPYLFSRTSERYSSSSMEVRSAYFDDGRISSRRIRPLYKEELDRPALVLGEWRGLGVLLASIGIFALYWGFAGRPEDFGPPIWVSDRRMVDFTKILDNDRVAASFVIDMWVYGIFQGWLVDDDWKRRGRSLEEEKFLRNVAKFVPFFGLASYLIFRPKFPSSRDVFDYDAFFNSRGSRRGGPLRRDRDDRGRGGGRFGDGFGGRFRSRN